ncbi:adenylate/guanylate cyclase domain-containing protein, partial [candidate division WOR-3 bacterium]|nr:adenylate/guanylate cyclase domain-containing protein [candidate division WOR-3 bacterium]
IILEEDTYLAGLVRDAMTNEGFLYAKILDEKYRIIASDKISEWGVNDSLFLLINENEIRTEKNEIKIIKPVMLGNEKLIGYVKLGISTKEIVKVKNDTILLISIITLIFIVIGIIISIFFSSFLTKQLKLLMEGVQRVSKGDLDVKVKRIVSDELGVLTDTFNEMVVNIREKEMIKMAFTRYVSKQVAEKVFEDPDAFLNRLKGERMHVSVMFADIMGFTTMSEKMSPEDVVNILNTYLSQMTDSVFRFDGTLDKFIGDCVMAVFGAPMYLENPSLNAVKSAIDIQKAVNKLNLQRRSNGLDAINVGIGINTGTAVVGNIGSSQRLDYTVIGDNVNLASRLQSAANNMNIPIIVSKSVIGETGDKIRYREMEAIMVKGKEKPVDIYSIEIV